MFHIFGDVDYLKKQVEDLQRQLWAEKAERLKLAQTMVTALQARIERLERYADEHATWHQTLNAENKEEHASLETRLSNMEAQKTKLEKQLINAVTHQLGEISQELTPILQPPAEPAPASTFWEKLCALFRV
ncbi:MAG: hypothetical protein IKV13_05400 [Akkermansia sp.]|nr:hypothetical protein [Akkermansia sp.]